MQPFEFQVSSNGGIATIDLNRPDEGNALTRDMMVQLSGLIRSLAGVADNRVVVVQGRGPQFCRGRDGRGESREGFSPYDVRTKMLGAVLGVYDAINEAPIPVVARVHAPAIGFGAALAGGCDITIASDTATFGFTEIKHGIPPTLAMSAVMSKVSAKALGWLIYSGEVISAPQALMVGLVSRVYPQTTFDKASDTFLAELASRSRVNLETIKKFQQNATGLSAKVASDYAGTLLAIVR